MSLPPDAVAARSLGLCRRPADGSADGQLGSGSSAKQTGTPPCLRRREESSAPDAVAVASTDGPSWCVPVAGWWPSLRQPSAHTPPGMGHASPTPHRRLKAHWCRRPQERRGRVPLERQNPRPHNTRTLRPWQICGAETKPARFASGLWFRPTPKGGSIGLFGYKKRGVRERDEAC